MKPTSEKRPKHGRAIDTLHGSARPTEEPQTDAAEIDPRQLRLFPKTGAAKKPRGIGDAR